MSFKILGKSVVSLCRTVFGETATYTPNGGAAVSIQATFDNAWVDVDGVSTLKPVLRISLSDLIASPGKGDTVSISSVNYRVLESRLDGFGGTTLILQRI